MKKVLVTLTLLASLNAHAFVLTQDTDLVPWFDSFDQAQYGNRWMCYVEAHEILMYPDYVVHPMSMSQSGRATATYLTTYLQRNSAPIWAATSTNLVISIYQSSGNGTPTSNQMRLDMGSILLAPVTWYDKSGNFTNDNPYTTSQSNRMVSVVFGDDPYNSLSADANSISYSGGAQQAALAANVLYFDCHASNNVMATTARNSTTGGTNLYLNFPSSDHPANELQLHKALSFLLWSGDPTNVFTIEVDCTALTATTNHCTATSIASSGGTISWMMRADRQATSFDVPDGFHTNDCRLMFTTAIDPTPMTNAFMEVIKTKNLSGGPYTLVWAGNNCGTYLASTLNNGINVWTNMNTPLWARAMKVLDNCRTNRNIRADNASDSAGNLGYIPNFISDAGSVWTTNTVGAKGLTNSPAMAVVWNKLQTLHATMHSDAQQTYSLIQLIPVPAVASAPFSP